MDRYLNAALNWLVNFALGFTAGSLLRDRATGLRLGAVLGTVSAVATLVIAGREESDGDGSELADAVEVPIE